MTRSSFAGAIRRAVRSFEPPLTALDVSLLAGTLSEGGVEELIAGERRPSLAELTAVSEAIGLPVDALLANQRVAGGDRDE